MEETILALDNDSAMNILAQVAPLPPGDHSPDAWLATHDVALRDAFGQPSDAASPVTRGQLARAALLVLAEDPTYRDKLGVLLAGQPERYGVLTTIAVVTAALLVLQTRVRFEWKNGKASLTIHKPSSDTTMLQSLAQKLLSFASPQ